MKQTSEPHIGRYANILLDRWFKRTFGWAPAKRLMQLFLQELIPEREIKTISYGPQEHVNPIEQGKDIRLDVDTSYATKRKWQQLTVSLEKLLPLAYSSVPLTRTSSDAYFTRHEKERGRVN